MIDILIKSFNRPYYLDRCLYSIQKFVSGDYTITVLDDGTPSIYLDKIQEKYPTIKIKKSKNYVHKANAIIENIKTGKEINGFQIPTDLWIASVKEASDYFIMTEEDVWFTEPINVDELASTMHRYNMVLIKLGWISNRPIKSILQPIPNTDILSIKPKIFTAPPFIMDWFFENKFKLFSLLLRLKIIDKYSKNEYWIMNALLMGFYNKEYWLKIWENFNNIVDETLQIKNAIQWYRKHKGNPYNFGKLKSLKMNTTFISSATNSYHKYGIDCDINIFNHIMNQQWYLDNFNAIQNFPKDISEDYYSSFLDKENNPKCTSKTWKKWAEKFKEQYRKQDVNVD